MFQVCLLDRELAGKQMPFQPCHAAEDLSIREPLGRSLPFDLKWRGRGLVAGDRVGGERMF